MTGEQNQEKPVKLIQPFESTSQADDNVQLKDPPAIAARSKPRSPILGIVSILVAFGWLWAAWFPVNREIHLIILGYSGKLIQWQSFFPGAEQLSDEERQAVAKILADFTIVKYVWLTITTFTACWLAMSGASAIAKVRKNRTTSWVAPGIATLCLAGAVFTGYLAISKASYAEAMQGVQEAEAALSEVNPDSGHGDDVRGAEPLSASSDEAEVSEILDLGTTGIPGPTVELQSTLAKGIKPLLMNAAKSSPGWTLVTSFLLATAILYVVLSSWYGRFSTLCGFVLIVIAFRFWMHSLRNVVPGWFLSFGEKPDCYWEMALVASVAVLSCLLAAGLTKKRAGVWVLIFTLMIFAILLLSHYLLTPFPAIATWTVMMLIGLASVCVGVLVLRWSHLLFCMSMPLVYLATMATTGGLLYVFDHQMLGEEVDLWNCLEILALQFVIFWVILVARPRGWQPVPEIK